MATLFTLKDSWYQSPWLHERLAYATNGDAILLIEDAVLALNSNVSLASFLAKCSAQNISVYALQPDVQARGIENQYAEVAEVSHQGFVELVVQYQKQVAW